MFCEFFVCVLYVWLLDTVSFNGRFAVAFARLKYASSRGLLDGIVLYARLRSFQVFLFLWASAIFLQSCFKLARRGEGMFVCSDTCSVKALVGLHSAQKREKGFL